MSNNIIELKKVSKSFEGHIVLQDINLEVKNGEFLTLLGPSGCGKTTVLRLISGFEKNNSGEIFIGGKNMVGLPPHLRHVNMVFQNYALFPHMNVFENVAFGLHCKKLPKNEIQQRVIETLKMVKLEEFILRKPAQLSGGQQQRVAIARAIINQPLVLLFDEPLSSLDYRLRKNMQIELKQLQRKLGITFIFVTHDQEEALSMSDRVVVIQDGKITQVGTPREVYEQPQNLSVATFIGEVNIFETTVQDMKGKNILAEIEGIPRELKNNKDFKMGDRIRVLVRPEDLRVWNRNEVDDVSQMYPATVEEVIYKGTTVDLMVRLKSNKLLAATEFFDEEDENLFYSIGESVWVEWTAGWEVILPYDK